MRLTDEEIDEIYDRMIIERRNKDKYTIGNWTDGCAIIAIGILIMSLLLFLLGSCANHDYMATKKRIYEENMGIAYEVVDGDTTFFFNIADSVIYQLEYMHKPEKEY
jgi:hypothetical protein